MDDDTKTRNHEARTIPVNDGDDLESSAATDPAGGGVADAEPSPDDVREAGEPEGSAEPQTEVEILRSELARIERELEQARGEAADAKERWLRARADLENVRRRSAGDVERAREAGLDSAVLPVLTTYDDLRRALQVADEEDPGKILPGVKAVLEALERNLASLGIERVGEEGDAFDPDVHDALTAVPAPGDAEKGTIAQVYEAGFRRGERLVRPARVVVYAEE